MYSLSIQLALTSLVNSEKSLAEWFRMNPSAFPRAKLHRLLQPDGASTSSPILDILGGQGWLAGEVSCQVESVQASSRIKIPSIRLRMSTSSEHHHDCL
jgi:hypothetical protein